MKNTTRKEYNAQVQKGYKETDKALNVIMSCIGATLFVSLAILIAFSANAHGISSAVHF